MKSSAINLSCLWHRRKQVLQKKAQPKMTFKLCYLNLAETENSTTWLIKDRNQYSKAEEGWEWASCSADCEGLEFDSIRASPPYGYWKMHSSGRAIKSQYISKCIKCLPIKDLKKKKKTRRELARKESESRLEVFWNALGVFVLCAATHQATECVLVAAEIKWCIEVPGC